MKKKTYIQTELIFHNKVLLFTSNLLLSCCRYEEYKGFAFFFCYYSHFTQYLCATMATRYSFSTRLILPFKIRATDSTI